MSDLIQQNATPQETQNDIEFKYLKIFTLRALGFTYKEIAEKTGFTSQHLRRLFMRGGKLHKPFLTFRTIAQQESIEEAQNIYFGSLPDVARTLVTTAKMPYEPSGVAAAKIIIEQTMGTPEKPLVQNNIQINNVNIPPERQEMIISAFKNFGVIENDTNKNTQSTDGERNNSEQTTEATGS